MNRLLMYMLMSGLCVCISCEKRSFPEPIDQLTPQFFIQGSANEQIKDIAGGVDDYYMFTDYLYDSSSSKYIFQGILSKTNCQDCPETLIIEISDSLERANGSTFGGEIPLPVKAYEYDFPSEQAGIQLRFRSSVPEEEALSYEWDFGDGGTSAIRSPTHIFPIINEGVTPIIHKVKRIDNCEAEIQKPVIIDTLGTDSCAVNFSIRQISPEEVIFVNESINLNGGGFEWQVEFIDLATDSIEVISDSSILQFSVLIDENLVLRSVTLTQLNDFCMGSVTKNFFRDAGVDVPIEHVVCDLDFTQDQEQFIVPTPPTTHQLKVSWINAEGTLFTSDRFSQSSNSFFRINNVKAFKENEKGYATFKADISFSCEVFNEEGETITLSNMDGVFGFAYP